ncbi:MAG: DUF6471 domain-containing protein [Campylobacter sp.]
MLYCKILDIIIKSIYLSITNEYEKRAKVYLKTQMAKADIDYNRLAELLKEKGVSESRENLANKINRGKFSFVFALMICELLEHKIAD